VGRGKTENQLLIGGFQGKSTKARERLKRKKYPNVFAHLPTKLSVLWQAKKGEGAAKRKTDEKKLIKGKRGGRGTSK